MTGRGVDGEDGGAEGSSCMRGGHGGHGVRHGRAGFWELRGATGDGACTRGSRGGSEVWADRVRRDGDGEATVSFVRRRASMHIMESLAGRDACWIGEGSDDRRQGKALG